MLELKNDTLVFSFPEVHPDARLTIEFQRTLRIPDDGRDYPLPPGLGRFPIRHVDDHSSRVPASWLQRGGVMLPMYQSEAMWLNFHAHHPGDRDSAYPFAIKIATGKINAASGEPWTNELRKKERSGWFGKQEQPNDYLVAPAQPWLDGYAVDKGRIRQFVAMPLGSGYSAEEQITGTAEFGGVQLIVYPMRGEVYDRRFPRREQLLLMRSEMAAPAAVAYDSICAEGSGMGLAPGGSMKQEIYDDQFEFSDWARDTSSRCFVHLANSLMWRAFTGAEPPHVPPTAREYEQAGYPWFDYYDDSASVSAGSATLNALKSVATLGKEKGQKPLPENASVNPQHVQKLKKKSPDEVRDGDF